MQSNDSIKPLKDFGDAMSALDVPTIERIHRGLYELQLMENPLLVEEDKPTDLSRALDTFSLFTSRLLMMKLIERGTTWTEDH